MSFLSRSYAASYTGSPSGDNIIENVVAKSVLSTKPLAWVLGTRRPVFTGARWAAVHLPDFRIF